MLDTTIATFIINLKIRTDRRYHILKEFANRTEFDVKLVEAVEDKTGAVGLWKSILKCIACGITQGKDYILICEDDHQFTEHYNKKHLYDCISEAQLKDADMLSGGVSWSSDILKISENLFYPQKFSGTQFIIIFKKFFSTILSADFNETDSADYKMSSLSKRIFFAYPFLSVQKEFGYSDATNKNNGTNRVEDLFKKNERKVAVINHICEYYKGFKYQPFIDMDYEAITIPTYIIRHPESYISRDHIDSQFKCRNEFKTTSISLGRQTIKGLGLWRCIRKIIKIAIDSDDDVIVICNDDHEFTDEYCKKNLLKNIVEAHQQGCDCLIGGSNRFDFVVPISSQRYWINNFSSTGFIVLYRKFFQKILDEPYDENINTDLKLSQMTSHKMILYPFIAKQRDFEFLNISENDKTNTTSIVDNMFNQTKMKLNNIHQLALDHNVFHSRS